MEAFQEISYSPELERTDTQTVERLPRRMSKDLSKAKVRLPAPSLKKVLSAYEELINQGKLDLEDPIESQKAFQEDHEQLARIREMARATLRKEKSSDHQR